MYLRYYNARSTRRLWLVPRGNRCVLARKTITILIVRVTVYRRTYAYASVRRVGSKRLVVKVENVKTISRTLPCDNVHVSSDIFFHLFVGRTVV